MSNINTEKRRQSVLATLVYIRDGDKTLMLHRVKKENADFLTRHKRELEAVVKKITTLLIIPEHKRK